MKNKNTKWWALGGLLLATVTFCAWREGNEHGNFQDKTIGQQDTVPAKKYRDKRDYRVGDLDDALQDIDRAMSRLDRDINIDMSQVEKTVRLAMEQVKKIDFDRIGRDVETALKQVDWTSVRNDVDKAMREAETELKKVDMKEVEKTVQKALEQVNTEKIIASIDFDRIGEEVEKGLAHARTGLEAAKEEITRLKTLTTELEKDGLIDKKKSYRLEVKDNELYIDGTKQSKEVNDKYRKYFGKGNYSINN